MDWTDIFKAIVCPVHTYWEAKASQYFWNPCQHFLSRFSSFMLGYIDIFFTFDFTEFNVIYSQAFSTDKTLCCFRKVSFCIQSNFLRRSFKIFSQIRLLVCQTKYTNSQTTWS